MDKKWIGVLIILFVSLLAIGSVSAASVERDFDGYFSMEVPKGVNFQKEINDTSENGVTNIYATYVSEHLMIMYADSPAFSENCSAFIYQTMFEEVNPDLTNCYESHDDDLTILEPTTKSELTFSLVGKSSGNKMLLVVSDGDVGTIKKMAHSAEF